MKTTIYIPVLDTDTNDFEYKGELGVKEYDEMVYDHFKRTDRQIDNYMNSYGAQNRDSFGKEVSKGDYDIDSTGGDEYKMRPCEAKVTDMNGDDVDKTFFDEHIENGKMSILIIDINPEKIDWDTSSELRFWIGDSDRVLKDKDIDDDTKIKTLPKTHFEIDVENERLKLVGCKLIEMYKEKNHPYKFGILINKISKI